MQYYPLLSPDSHSGAQAKETNFVNHFYTNHNATCLPPPRPAQIIFNFTWDDCNTQQKLETMVMQSLGGNKGGLWSM